MSPTRLGRYLLGLNFLIFILAISYSNNLLLLFSLFLIGQTAYWYIETVRYQHKDIGKFEIASVYLGEDAYLNLEMKDKNIPKLVLKINDHKYKLKQIGRNASEGLFALKLPKRGKYQLTQISFYLSAPFGLFAKKMVHNCQYTFFIYPALLKDSVKLTPTKKENQNGQFESNHKGDEDFSSLDKYQSEDFKKISWKHFARSEELYVKKGSSQEAQYLDLNLRKDMSEEEISKLATEIYWAHKNQIKMSLKSENDFIPYGEGESHFRLLMEKVSQW